MEYSMNGTRKCIFHYCGNYSLYGYNCLEFDLVIKGRPISTLEILLSVFISMSWFLIFMHWRKLNKRIKHLEKSKFV